MPSKEKLAAGSLVTAVLSFLLWQNSERQAEHAKLIDRIAHLEGRTAFFHGLPSLDEIKAEQK